MIEPLPKPSGPPARTRVVRDGRTLAGTPILSGTRIPAATILAYLRAGHAPSEIRVDYPALPTDGIAAVEAWATREYGVNWRSSAAAAGA